MEVILIIMGQRLKRWESPRREGRNDKGRGGSARARQLKKQAQMLRKTLKEDETENNKKRGEEKIILPPIFYGLSALRLSLNTLLDYPRSFATISTRDETPSL